LSSAFLFFFLSLRYHIKMFDFRILKVKINEHQISTGFLFFR